MNGLDKVSRALRTLVDLEEQRTNVADAHPVAPRRARSSSPSPGTQVPPDEHAFLRPAWPCWSASGPSCPKPSSWKEILGLERRGLALRL
jgi:hypothetical protein